MWDFHGCLIVLSWVFVSGVLYQDYVLRARRSVNRLCHVHVDFRKALLISQDAAGNSGV